MRNALSDLLARRSDICNDEARVGIHRLSSSGCLVPEAVEKVLFGAARGRRLARGRLNERS